MEKAFLTNENFNKKINKFFDTFNPHKYYLNKHMRYIYLRFFDKLPTNENIFDIGGGRSPYKSLFIKNDNNYYTIDIDLKRYSKLDIVASVDNLPFKNSSADIIIFNEVLEHIFDFQKTIDELYRILKNGGYLIITVPFMIGKHDTFDFFRFTDDALKRILEAKGFNIEVIKERGGIFACLASIIYAMPNILFRKKKVVTSIFLLFLSPIIFFVILLDKFDKYREFTLGYEILVKK